MEPAASKPNRRWYRRTPWSPIVGERHQESRFSLRRLMASVVLFALAGASPSFVHLRFDYTSGLWAILTASLLCAFVGAAIGLLMAGGRGAIAGGLTAVIWLLIAIGTLLITVVLIARH